jgi:signal transduction histidine kinase
LGSAILVGACYGSALTTNPGQAFEGLWRLIGVTMGVSVAFGLAFVPLFSWQLLEPVRVLRRGTQSVGLGDLSTRLPVITRDEFGELTASFNHMVVGLRERAELRVNNANLVRELQASRERIVTAADAARRRVERDLHDGAQQQLVMARLKVRMLRRDLADLAVIPERIEEIETEIDRALIELRELAHGIYPAQLDDDGLAGAFEYAVTRAAIRCEFECDSIGRYSAELEAALYFSGIEALQNASKYAGPNATAQLRLHESADAVVLTVSDDGAGFDAALPAPRSGLQNIADRVGALGGHVTIQSSPGRGTTVCARIPLMHADEGHCEPRSAE